MVTQCDEQRSEQTIACGPALTLIFVQPITKNAIYIYKMLENNQKKKY